MKGKNLAIVIGGKPPAEDDGNEEADWEDDSMDPAYMEHVEAFMAAIQEGDTAEAARALRDAIMRCT